MNSLLVSVTALLVERGGESLPHATPAESQEAQCHAAFLCRRAARRTNQWQTQSPAALDVALGVINGNEGIVDVALAVDVVKKHVQDDLHSDLIGDHAWQCDREP